MIDFKIYCYRVAHSSTFFVNIYFLFKDKIYTFLRNNLEKI